MPEGAAPGAAGSTPRKAAVKRVASRRMAPDEREQQIVRAAVAWFAERGFSGSTRELARRLGIAQPLLYRYFPTKAKLIDRVFEEVFLTRWRPEWEDHIEDESRPLEERLVGFYVEYSRAMLQREWIRILMFSGLDGADVVERLLERLRSRIFVRVVRAIRRAQGLPTDPATFTDMDYEIVWSLHASIFYIGIRRWVYGLPVREDTAELVRALVRSFLRGAPAMIGLPKNR